MSNSNSHYEPGVMSIPSTDAAEELIERAQLLTGADEERARKAVARQYEYAVMGAAVIDEESRERTVVNANQCDTAYRQALLDHRQAEARREDLRADREKAGSVLGQFLVATHQGSGVPDPSDGLAQKHIEASSGLDNSIGGWMRAINRLHVALPYTVYVAILAASVVLGFLVDNGAFNALQLSQKTLGFSTTNGLAAAFAVLIPALGHIAGILVWWMFDPDAEAQRKRRPSVLLALSLASAAFLVTTIVTLRIAYLHHTGASVPVWPLIGISLSVLFVDVSASALRHNPWPAKRTQLVDDEDDVKEALRTAEEAVVVTGKKVMVTQANLATALEKLLDSHFVHLTDKAALIEMLGDEKAVEGLASGALMFPPQDAARLRWVTAYNESTPPPCAPMAVDGGLVPYTASASEDGETDNEASAASPEDEDEVGASVRKLAVGQ